MGFPKPATDVTVRQIPNNITGEKGETIKSKCIDRT